MLENEDDDELEALYENGRWVWNDLSNQLVYERAFPLFDEDFNLPAAAAFGPVEFRDDLDLIEQQRFRKRYQRKTEGELDVIYLHDVIDVVLYTTPSCILTPTVVQILHLPTTSRFLRALIFYCQYYLQTADEMSTRMLELETKIRTARSQEVELELRDNIEDLRLLVAKEYLMMTIGGDDYKKFHHMGPNKKLKSLSKKDAIVFESFLRISIQIVWLALGRKSLNIIELEVNRMFKSQIFNIVEHKLKTNYVAHMAPYERCVLIGNCLRQGGKLTTKSPLMNGLLCHRTVDFRLLGIGTSKFPLSITKASRSSMRKSTMAIQEKLYGFIQLPSKEFEKDWMPEEFPTDSGPRKKSNLKQRRKWLARIAQLTAKHIAAKNSFG